MSFTLTDDPQFYGLEMSLSNILMIDLFRSNSGMVFFSKTGRKFTSQQTRMEPYIYDVHMEEDEVVLKICHISADSFVFTQKIYCSFFQMKGVRGSQNV